MNRLQKISFLLAGLIAAIAFSAQAQQYSCSELDWPDQIASIREHVAPACEEVVDIDGRHFARVDATFLREIAGEVTLSFLMPDGNTVIETFRPPEDFRVKVDDKAMAFHQLTRGQKVTLLIPEQE